MDQLPETPEEARQRKGEEDMIIHYVKNVEETLSRYQQVGDLIRETHVPMDKVYRALAMFYEVNNRLASEYQRAKVTHQALERKYEAWYDKKFTEARTAIIDLYKMEVKGSLKPAVKEYEIYLRVENATQYEAWQINLQLAEAKVQFLLRLRENLERHHRTLTELSSSMRSEIRALQISEPSQEGDPPPPTGTATLRRRPLHG